MRLDSGEVGLPKIIRLFTGILAEDRPYNLSLHGRVYQDDLPITEILGKPAPTIPYSPAI